jgi:dTDP-4-dehydrorhamnose reductase
VRIFITGHKGQLGTALLERFQGYDLFFGDLPEWDIADADQVAATFRETQPDVVIHAAALTRVDYCAEHPDEALRVNGLGTYNVALACRAVDAMLVAISTSEVFDGEASAPYQEYDRPNPGNPYGYSKWVGEQVVERVAPRNMIIRTAWLYAPGGQNFIHKIIAQAEADRPLRVVKDEIGSPTYVGDLANAIAKLIVTERVGIYHLVNEGVVSRYEFAEEILRLSGLAHISVEPITLAEFERPSKVPPYTPLANMFAAAAGVHLRSWREALAGYIDEFGQEPPA